MPEFAGDVITSRKNPLITRLSKLSDKKYRDREGLFRVDGVKLYEEAAKSGLLIPYTFVSLSKKDKLPAELMDTLKIVGGEAYLVSDEVLEKLTDEASPQGIVGFVKKFDSEASEIPDGTFRSLYLSEVRDPGNLGTIIRTAYAFGVDRVFISADCADIYSPKTVRASMGTAFRQPFSYVLGEAEFINSMKEKKCPLYAAALRRDARALGSFEIPSRVCFAIGNEGHGLPDEFIDSCDGTVFIPMNEGCESLNAAAAANVLIWEMCRAALIN